MSDLRKAALANVVAFLMGEAPLDGVWFGETHPTERGQFWWRKHLRVALAQPDQSASDGWITSPDGLSRRLAAPDASVAVGSATFTVPMTAAQSVFVRSVVQPTADGPTREDGRSAPDLAASDRGLPEPAAYARWWEQNAHSVQQLECLRKFPEVEAYWKDRSKLALFTASQMRAFRAEGVEQERDALRLDAERYRWLCVHRLGWFSRMAPIPWKQQSMKDALDAAIAAAMKEKP